MAKFTVYYLENLKPGWPPKKDDPTEKEYTGKEYTLTFGDGRYVRVFPDGRKILFYYYVSPVTGQRRKYRVGEWPKISLADASKSWKQLAAKVENKIDPLEEDRERREAIRVRDLVELYMERWAKPRKRTWREDERNLQKDVVPRWGRRKARDIKRADVIALLDDVAYRGENKKKGKAHNAAAPRHVLAVVRRMFNFAMERDLLEKNPCRGVKLPVKPPKPRKRALTLEEVKQFWLRLPDSGMREDYQRILKLVLLTGQRPGEVAGMDWEEIDGRWWTIPGERSKNRRESRVYLTDMALEILGDPGEGLLFPTPGDPDRAVVSNDVAKAMRRALGALELENVKPHDLRTTFTTLAARAGIQPEIVDRILNHIPQSVRGRHYDDYNYNSEKQRAMEKWARHFREILEGKTSERVVPIQG